MSDFLSTVDKKIISLLPPNKRGNKDCRMAVRAYSGKLVADALNLDSLENIGFFTGLYYGFKCIGWNSATYIGVIVVMPILLFVLGIVVSTYTIAPPLVKAVQVTKDAWDDASSCDTTVDTCKESHPGGSCFVHDGEKYCVEVTTKKLCTGTRRRRSCRYIRENHAIPLTTEKKLDAYNIKRKKDAVVMARMIGAIVGMLISSMILGIVNFYVKQRVIGFVKALGMHIIEGLV